MIKSILVVCTGEKPEIVALEYAVALAAQHSAHLTGILPLRLGLDQLGVPKWLSDDLKSQISESINIKNGDIRERFENIASAKLPKDKVYWINSNNTPDQTLVEYARMFDISIVASPPKERSPSDIHPDVVAMQSGLPILIVLDGATSGTFGQPAVVAWDGQRAATRALRDALVLLHGRSRVSIVTVEGRRTGKPLPGIDVQTVLGRHGIEAEWEKIKTDGLSVADRIQKHCEDIGAGLLVMGAYEHSKFSEDIFGGVTRDISRQTKVPVLLSH